jgi:hypothetical protein
MPIVTPGPITTLDNLFDEYEREIERRRAAMTPADRQRERDEDAATIRRMKEERRRKIKAGAIERRKRTHGEEE